MKSSNVLRKIAKLGLNQVQNMMVRACRAAGVFDFPVPPNSSMRKTSSKTIRHYFISGIQSYMPIATCALQKGVELDRPINILDFGCGVGRILLHFTRHFPAPSYYACDVDDTSVAFITDNYSRVAAYANNFSPPLKYSDQLFDAVYSVSIFSHLNMDDQEIWLKELARITKPGGWCFLTTEGIAALKWLAKDLGRDREELEGILAKDGWLYKEYEDLDDNIRRQSTLRIASPMVGIESSYGNTVLSPKYVAEKWGEGQFEVIDIIEGIIDHRQDLVVLRRRCE